MLNEVVSELSEGVSINQTENKLKNSYFFVSVLFLFPAVFLPVAFVSCLQMTGTTERHFNEFYENDLVHSLLMRFR